MPLILVSVSHYANNVTNGTTVFLRSELMKQNATCLFGQMMPLAMALASYDASGIINGTIVFPRSR